MIVAMKWKLVVAETDEYPSDAIRNDERSVDKILLALIWSDNDTKSLLV